MESSCDRVCRPAAFQAARRVLACQLEADPQLDRQLAFRRSTSAATILAPHVSNSVASGLVLPSSKAIGAAMSNLGVFHWIRDAVRRSVLLGFSDAVEQLGGPAESNEELHPQLAAVLREAAAPSLTATLERPAAKQQRKRLGRSLDGLRQVGPKPADGKA